MDKLFQNIPGLQPKIKEIQKEFKDETNEIEPIDDIRDGMLEKIIETEVSDTKVKKLLPKLGKILKQLELPELTEEEKEDLK
jgi:hypothetical protein